MKMAVPKTKEMVTTLKTLGVEGKTMIVLPEMDEAIRKASRNIPEVMTVVPSTMNLLDLLSRDKVLMTVDAVNAVTQWLGVD